MDENDAGEWCGRSSSERHSLPLVSGARTFVGGANQYEPANKPGLATFTASQMLEGTTTHRRSDLERHAAPRREPAVDHPGESGNVALSATRDKLAPALDILADVIVNPTFPQDALERYRARTLNQPDAGA